MAVVMRRRSAALALTGVAARYQGLHLGLQELLAGSGAVVAVALAFALALAFPLASTSAVPLALGPGAGAL